MIRRYLDNFFFLVIDFVKIFSNVILFEFQILRDVFYIPKIFMKYSTTRI